MALNKWVTGITSSYKCGEITTISRVITPVKPMEKL